MRLLAEKCFKMRLRPGLRPGPRWGSLQRSPSAANLFTVDSRRVVPWPGMLVLGLGLIGQVLGSLALLVLALAPPAKKSRGLFGHYKSADALANKCSTD